MEYEQKGEDRAKYGEKLLRNVADEIQKKRLKGLSFTNLKLFRKFYLVYSQTGQTLSGQLPGEIIQSLPEQFSFTIRQTSSDEIISNTKNLMTHLSFN